MKHAPHDLASIIGQLGTPKSIRDQLDQFTGRGAMLREIERISQPRLELERYIERYLGSAASMHRSLEQYLRHSGIHGYAKTITQQSRSIQEEYKRTLASQVGSIGDEYKRAPSLQTSVVDWVTQLSKSDLLLSQMLAQDVRPLHDHIEAIVGKLARPMVTNFESDSLRQLQRMLRETALDQVSVAETGSIKVAGEEVVLDGTTWDMERVTLTPQPAAGLLEDLVSWLAVLAPLVRAAVIYLLLPYIVSIVANINTPLHEEWWKSLQADSTRAAKKEVRQGASAAYSSTDLETFRFVTAKSLSVHQAGRQRSPTTDDIPFGKVVRLLRRDGSWSYVEYAGGATREVQQGWVLSRYLEKFDK